MPQYIQYTHENGVASITLNKPPLNILDIAMMLEINQVLASLRADVDLKLIVFSAMGKAFSAGVSVEEHQPETVVDMINQFHKMFEHLHHMMIPSLALVQGPALGGGCELALFCDLVLADERATFGQPEVKLAFFAPIAAIILPQLVGRNRALELMITGDLISAQEAAQMGLINRVIPVESFAEESEAMIGKIANLSSAALRFNRRAVDEIRHLPFEQQLRHIEDMFLNQLMVSEDVKEGISAFVGKRKPVWKNR
ncbi:MAG: enoyl-CoA hydratase-related protein [bacterium]